MSTQVQWRKGTTAEHASFTGVTAEITVDTTKDVVVVHDGATAGGHPMLPEVNPSSSGTLTHSGDVNLTGSGKRITGDFSTATIANRVMFQTSTVNGQTEIGAITNGTGSTSSVSMYNSSDANNASVTRLGCTSTDSRLAATRSGTGTYLPMTFYTGGSERMRIDTSGNVGIGTSSTIGTKFIVVNDRAVNTYMQKWTSYNGATFENDLTLGYDGATYLGNFQAKDFYFVTNNTERMRIDSSGNVLVTNPAGLGYGTGAGGTVTQSTSKFTAVTLNKPTGQITMNNAALAAGTAAVFAVNNSLVSASDTVLLTFSGNWISNYSLRCTVYSGQFYVLLKNESGGSLSESVVINFAIIKGATA